MPHRSQDDAVDADLSLNAEVAPASDGAVSTASDGAVSTASDAANRPAPPTDYALPPLSGQSVVVDAAHAAVARATAREVAVHEAYDRARNVLRLQARRRALVPLTREMFSTPGRLDAHAGRSMPAHAWGMPVARRGQLLAVICPTASAITPAIRAALATTVIVVASPAEEDRLARVTDPRQRFALLSVRVPEPTHEEIVDFARRNPMPNAASRNPMPTARNGRS